MRFMSFKTTNRISHTITDDTKAGQTVYFNPVNVEYVAPGEVDGETLVMTVSGLPHWVEGSVGAVRGSLQSGMTNG